MITRDFQQLDRLTLGGDSPGIPRDSLSESYYRKKGCRRNPNPRSTETYIRNLQGTLIRLIDRNEIYSNIDDKRYSLSELILAKEQVESELEKRIPAKEYLEESGDNNSYFTEKQLFLESRLKNYQTSIKQLWNHLNK